jgi:hypothetical protein
MPETSTRRPVEGTLSIYRTCPARGAARASARGEVGRRAVAAFDSAAIRPGKSRMSRSQLAGDVNGSKRVLEEEIPAW